LGLELLEPLDAFRLAGHLSIDTLPMSELSSEAPRSVRHFGLADISAFSAVTVFSGTQRLIVYNDSHSTGRQASDVAHECSHALLLHPPVQALDGAGCRNWDAALEEEAQWLAGALLVTEEAALSIVRQATPLATAAANFGVSEAMVRFRVNVTGAHKRVARARGQHAS
jgi:Zn-dependent peptidase ImmA (M78 family)